jgi:uncharacterized protein (UPF0332 family)
MKEEFIEKALESLKAAGLLYDSECHNSCVSRCYYAMFQIAIAALLNEGIKLPEGSLKHEWVQSQFSGLLVWRRKIYSDEYANYLHSALSIRIDADYKHEKVSKNKTQDLLKKTKKFVEEIKGKIS